MASTPELNHLHEWPVEPIPDSDFLFMRVHKNDVDNGDPKIGVFRNRGEGDEAGMSTDWDEYSTPQQTRDRAPNPERNGVIRMNVADIRKIPLQEVIHHPFPKNPAHTNVTGDKKAVFEGTQVRYLFFYIYQWVIQIPANNGTPPSG